MPLPPGSVTVTRNIGRIFSVPIRGGQPTLLVDSIPGHVAGLSVTPAKLLAYGAAGDFLKGSSLGSLWTLDLAQVATPNQIVSGLPTAWPGGLSTDASNVYWPDQTGVHSVPVAGGSVQTITTQSVSDARPFGDVLLVDDATNGNVLSIPIAGGSVTTLASGQVNPAAAQACGQGTICWSDLGALTGSGSIMAQGAAIMRLDANGQLTTLYMPGVRAGIIYDGHDLYAEAGDCCGGKIVRIPLDGSPPVDITTTAGGEPFAVDDECVYWADPSVGVLSKNKT
jgi:hypothetical protein